MITAYGFWLGFWSCSGCAGHESSLVRMVTRFTAITNRFIFRLRKIIGGELPLETETCRFVLNKLA